MNRVAIACLALLLVACQGEIPKPFAVQTAPPPGLRPPDAAGIFVLPAEGAPQSSAAALAQAMATALQDSDVPASATFSNQESYRLVAKATTAPLDANRQSIALIWELRDSHDALVGSVNSRIDAATAGWSRGDSELARALALPAAPALAKLIQGNAPLPSGGLNPVVAVREVQGAPGDGDRALTRAMGAALQRTELTVAAPGAKGDYVLTGTVAVSPPDGQRQRVKVLWILARADGSEIGRINQENAVPAGSLDRAWGDVAYAVTGAAAPGVRRLVEEAQLPPANGS
jgi:hypothetical protein